MSNCEVNDRTAVGETSQGVEIRASLVRLTRYQAVLEIYNPSLILHSSEVIKNFKVTVQQTTIYSGRAVVTNQVNTGSALVCELKLDESSFITASFIPLDDPLFGHDFTDFLDEWQRIYKVLPEFKVVVADMQTFLSDLRLWLDQVELGMHSLPDANRMEAEQDRMHELGNSMVPAFNAMHERLEMISEKIDQEFRPVHQNFSKRQLHPLVMCSPFAYRTYHKPLGYAGDYEMVNMITRDPYEGTSIYSKIVNLWFLQQWPSEAHRNRIHYLKKTLVQESLRGVKRARPIRVLNLGCGPAREIQEFLATEDIASEYTEFTLWDFNDETIAHTDKVLTEIKRRYNRRTKIQLQKKSVHHVLKEGSRPIVLTDQNSESSFDLIYCAGLFDYLSSKTCSQLMNIFYDRLSPGGLLLATNVDDAKPFRNMLEFVLDWHLIYRDVKKGKLLLPDRSLPNSSSVTKDSTEVNVFIETRKQNHA